MNNTQSAEWHRLLFEAENSGKAEVLALIVRMWKESQLNEERHESFLDTLQERIKALNDPFAADIPVTVYLTETAREMYIGLYRLMLTAPTVEDLECYAVGEMNILDSDAATIIANSIS